MPPIKPNVMYKYGNPSACDDTANAADAINAPTIVIGLKPHRFAIAETNGPAIK